MAPTEIAVRAWLLGGMVFHKAVWEAMKRGRTAPRGPLLARAVKIFILAGLVAQTLLPPVLPMSHSPNPAAGLAIFTLGLAIAVTGRVQLGSNWSDIETAGVLAGQQVVDRGIYRFIRHPIYTGDLLLILGLELALNCWLVLGVLLLAPPVVRRALREERALHTALPGYDAYCARTRRFIPFVY